MPRRVDGDDWSDDDYDWDDSDDDGENGPDEDEEASIPCPYCSRQIHEDSPCCPYCGKYISEEDSPPSRKPWWIIIGVVLCLYVIYRWIMG